MGVSLVRLFENEIKNFFKIGQVYIIAGIVERLILSILTLLFIVLSILLLFKVGSLFL